LKNLQAAFIILILGSADHLGDLPVIRARLINVIVCTCLAALIGKGKAANFLFLVLFSIPVWLNVVAYAAVVASKDEN
jgi:positive regulator of sigma E activity